MTTVVDGRIVNASQILETRLGVEFAKQVITALGALQLQDVASGNIQVTKHDRAGWARLLASGLHRAVGDGTRRAARIDPTLANPLVLGGNLRLLNTLRAERALLHHAAHAHGDFRVELHLGHIRRTILEVVLRLGHQDAALAYRIAALVIKEVESTHLVRAVVTAVARTDATVVDHVVQAVQIMDGGRHRAHLLARRVLAVHAGHRLYAICVRLRCGAALEVTVNTDPVHLATASHLILTNDRNVVLCLACHDAGAATSARCKVNGHCPAILGSIKV